MEGRDDTCWKFCLLWRSLILTELYWGKFKDKDLFNQLQVKPYLTQPALDTDPKGEQTNKKACPLDVHSK